MARDLHLSIRISSEEKAELQRQADQEQISLGQLARVNLPSPPNHCYDSALARFFSVRKLDYSRRRR